MHGFLIEPRDALHLLVAHAGHLTHVLRATDSDVRLHARHAIEVVCRPCRQVLFARAFVERAHDAVVPQHHVRIRTYGAGFFNHGEHDRIGSVKRFDQNVLTLRELGRVTNENLRESANAWVDHGRC